MMTYHILPSNYSDDDRDHHFYHDLLYSGEVESLHAFWSSLSLCISACIKRRLACRVSRAITLGVALRKLR